MKKGTEKIVRAAVARNGEMTIARGAVRWIWICQRCRLRSTIRSLMRHMNRPKPRLRPRLNAINRFRLPFAARLKARKRAELPRFWAACFANNRLTIGSAADDDFHPISSPRLRKMRGVRIDIS